MDLAETKQRVEELQSSLEGVVDFLQSIGFEDTLLEETESLLRKLSAHIEVLQKEESLGRLEIELRKTHETLSSLRGNLLAYPEPNQELIGEVEAAQAEVEKNLVRVKRGRKTKGILPLVLLGGAVLYAVSRR